MNISGTSGSSSTNTGRITGLASGLDVDALVKSNLQPYKTRADKQTQQKEVLEIKQKLYRDLAKDGRAIFDKHLSKSDSLAYSSSYSAASFDSSNSGVVTAKGVAGGKVGNYTVNVTEIAKGANTTFKFSDLDIADTEKALSFEYGGKTVNVDITSATDDASLTNIINKAVSSLNMKATYSEFDQKIVVETNATGKDQTFKVAKGKIENDGSFTPNGGVYTPATSGTNLIAKISNGTSDIIYGDNTLDPTIRVSSSNSVTIDGVQFSFVGKSDGGATTNITGKSDVSGIKAKITNFLNDYNALMEKMNKLLNDKRDRTYQPLTADQKKDMSETEIKLWNEKVESGQLRRDDDISRISNNLRSSASNPVDGTNLYLEKIGIEPAKDYGGNKYGTLNIVDEEKLTQALQNDPEGVMNLFISSPGSDPGLTETQKYNKTGIINRMKDVINSEFKVSSSPLSKKAGFEGFLTATKNDLSQSISKYEKKIKDMQKDLSRREQSLYSKYSKLETAMNKYNSQQSYLSSQLGGQ